MAAFIIFNIGLLFLILFAARNTADLRTPFLVFLATVLVHGNLRLAGVTDSLPRLLSEAFVWIGLAGLGLGLWRAHRRLAVADFRRFSGRLTLLAVMPGLIGFVLAERSAWFPAWAGTFATAAGIALALLLARPLYLLRQFSVDPGNRELLFEDRFFDLVRGVRALKEVLLDRQIQAGRVLILNPEENLSIERASSRAEVDPASAPVEHLAGFFENYQRMERHMSLMNFALMRYEQASYSSETLRQGSIRESRRPGGLRIQDPLLVLYHYLENPRDHFPLSDALDVIEREDLGRLMRRRLVVRRPGAGLMLAREALERAEKQPALA